ncbi:MAG: SDR family oxidoreductase [Geminicoccaceae bacterium]|nr:SDR family oxidoreductase [Geminicoccaceae bacterium]
MGKVLLVTGGSRGIGAACCRLGAREGYDVAVNYKGGKDKAEAVRAEVESSGRRALAVRADVTDEAAVERMLDEVEAGLGPVDAFVSNAGIIHASRPLMDMNPAEIRKVIEVDLTAHILCNRAVVRRMARSKGGRGGAIVNLSSMAASLYGAGGFVPYGAAKGGIDVLTMGLGREAAGDGIRVNGLRPGLIDTDMQNDTGVERRMERFGPGVPIGRGGTAEEVAECVLWLLSDKASYVTGTLFDVSGGR